MRNAGSLLSLLLLLSVLSVPCQAGNNELMQKWAAKKQYVRDQVLEELRKKGDLPQNGIIQFEARVKTGKDGSVTTFEIDSVEVYDNAAAKTEKQHAPKASDASAGFKGGAGVVREETIDFARSAPDKPVGGAAGRLGGTYEVRISGKLTEGVLDIPGTAVICDAVKLEDGKPVEPVQTPLKTLEKAEQAPAADPGGPEGSHPVGDEKTEKSWWKIW